MKNPTVNTLIQSARRRRWVIATTWFLNTLKIWMSAMCPWLKNVVKFQKIATLCSKLTVFGMKANAMRWVNGSNFLKTWMMISLIGTRNTRTVTYTMKSASKFVWRLSSALKLHSSGVRWLNATMNVKTIILATPNGLTYTVSSLPVTVNTTGNSTCAWKMIWIKCPISANTKNVMRITKVTAGLKNATKRMNARNTLALNGNSSQNRTTGVPLTAPQIARTTPSLSSSSRLLSTTRNHGILSKTSTVEKIQTALVKLFTVSLRMSACTQLTTTLKRSMSSFLTMDKRPSSQLSFKTPRKC